MLELKNIGWTASDGEEILRNISLEIPEGKMTVITGPNGGGKTSLAKLIAGLITPHGRADSAGRPGYHPLGYDGAGPSRNRLRLSAAGEV